MPTYERVILRTFGLDCCDGFSCSMRGANPPVCVIPALLLTKLRSSRFGWFLSAVIRVSATPHRPKPMWFRVADRG